MQRYRPLHRSGYKAHMSYQSTSHYNTPIYLVSSDGVLILWASSSLLRASSFFNAHLQHDQDFPSDTRPRDDLAPRLAPGHVLAAHPVELHLTINMLPMATPVMASSNFHASHMIIRILHTYHCRVQYFSLDPWGIVTSAGGYIHWRRSSHLNSTSAHHQPAVSPIQLPDISRTNCIAIVDFDAIQVPHGCPNPTIPLMSLTIPHALSDMTSFPDNS